MILVMNKAIDPTIDKKIISELSAFAKAHSEIELLMVFGSTARNEQRIDSDLDIAVAATNVLDYENRVDLALEIETKLKIPTEIIDLRQVEGLILYEIMTEGLVILDSSELRAILTIKALGFYEDLLPQISKARFEQAKRFVDEE